MTDAILRRTKIVGCALASVILLFGGWGAFAAGLVEVPDGGSVDVGSVGLGQTVHDLAPFPGGKRVLGVAGGPRDLGTVFTYDDEAGLVLHGRIFFQDHASPGVLGASSEPRLAAVSPDGRCVAIAVGDRMSCVYWFELKNEIVD